MVVSISLAIPTVISMTGEQDDHHQHGTNNEVQALSHSTAIVIFVLFISYLAFRFKSHPNLFPRAVLSSSTMEFQLGFIPRTGSLSIVLLGTAICAITSANYLIRSVDDTIKKLGVTKSFIGVVFLPFVGNIAKSVVIVATSRTRRLDFAIRTILTNILDTLLFITPFVVLLGWVINQPMELDFGFFESIVFLLAMIVMTYLLQHGKSTYFEGFMLIGT